MSFIRSDLSSSNLSVNLIAKTQTVASSISQDISVDRFIYSLKIITVGDSGVGKTSLIKSFADQEFSTNYQCTITPESCIKKINIDPYTGAELTIWDTCGQEKFRSMTRQYYNDANGILLVYDITNKKSFNSLNNWMKDIKENSPNNVSIMLVGNKIDLDRNVSIQEVNEYAQSEGLLFVETSSKEGRFVEVPFQNLVEDIINKIKKSEGDNKKVGESNTIKRIETDDSNKVVKIQTKKIRKKEKNKKCC